MGCVKTSNLNFCLQLSPFSANISIKKSFIKDKSGSPLKPSFEFKNGDMSQKITELENIIEELKFRLADSVTDLEQANETIRQLELKLHVKEEKIESIENEFEKKKDLENEKIKQSYDRKIQE